MAFHQILKYLPSAKFVGYFNGKLALTDNCTYTIRRIYHLVNPLYHLVKHYIVSYIPVLAWC